MYKVFYILQAQIEELMLRDAPTSGVCANESISWSRDDPYAQVMGSEWLGHVRGVGFGHTSGHLYLTIMKVVQVRLISWKQPWIK